MNAEDVDAEAHFFVNMFSIPISEIIDKALNAAYEQITHFEN